MAAALRTLLLVIGVASDAVPDLQDVCLERIANQNIPSVDLLRGTRLRIAGPQYKRYCSFPDGMVANVPHPSSNATLCVAIIFNHPC